MRRPSIAVVALALSACQSQAGQEAPWNTYPGIAGHARYLPLAGTSHEPTAGGPVTCEGCHTTPDTFSKFECTGCHAQAETTARHTPSGGGAPIAGYAWTTADCMRCHPTGGITDADHAVFFPIGAAAKHERVCTSCHSDPLDKPNLATLQCVACHSDATRFPAPDLTERHVHAIDQTRLPVLDYPAAPAPADCLRCHADSQVDFIASHGRQTGPEGRAGPGDGQHDSHCFTCHPVQGVPNRPWAQDWAQASCRPCH